MDTLKEEEEFLFWRIIKNSKIGKSILKQYKEPKYFIDWLTVNSPFAQKFKVKNIDSLFIPEFELNKNIIDVSQN